MSKEEICAYCGKKSQKLTRDHVFPKGLYTEGYKKKPITVPCCEVCNNKFSFDEEYFRQFLCSISLDKSEHAKDVFMTRIKRSIERRPQIGHKFKNKMELVNAFTPNGLYIGKKTKISISKKDWERYFRVLDKIIRGLYFHSFGKPLDSKYQIKHIWANDKKLSNATPHISNWVLDNKEIYLYGFNLIPDTPRGMWVTVFYEQIAFISFVVTEKDFKYMESQRKSS